MLETQREAKQILPNPLKGIIKIRTGEDALCFVFERCAWVCMHVGPPAGTEKAAG